MTLLPEKNYDLNALMKGYDMLITNKNQVKVQELGDTVIDFLSNGKYG